VLASLAKLRGVGAGEFYLTAVGRGDETSTRESGDRRRRSGRGVDHSDVCGLADSASLSSRVLTKDIEYLHLHCGPGAVVCDEGGAH
jgi:hypothetical protein